jgi:hypothetical protein
MLLATRLSDAAKKPRLRQAVAGFPERDIGLHGHLGRHPMVVAGGQILLPGPAVLHRQELIHVGAAIDHRLLVN